MNRAPLNANPINGSILTRQSGSGAIEVKGTLPLSYGVMLSAASSIEVAANGAGYKRSRPSAQAPIAFNGSVDARAVQATFGESIPNVEVWSSAVPHAIMQPNMLAQVEIAGDVDDQAAKSIDGDGAFEVAVESDIYTDIRSQHIVQGKAAIAVAFVGSPYNQSAIISDADIDLIAQSEEVVAKSVMGQSLGEIETNAELVSSMIMVPEMASTIAVQADQIIRPAKGQHGTGKVDIHVDAESKEYKRSRPNAFAQIDTQSFLDSRMKMRPGLEAPIRVQATNALRVATGHHGKTHAYVRFEPRLGIKAAKSRQSSTSFQARVSAHGRAALVMASQGGMATIKVAAIGAARLGAKIHGSGRSDIAVYARGLSDKWRHMHGGGNAELRILFEASGVGRPPIPEHYVPAHPSWQFTVAGEDWRFVVPKDRRRLP